MKFPFHLIKQRYITTIRSQTVARDSKVYYLSIVSLELLKNSTIQQFEAMGLFSIFDKIFNTLLHQLHTRKYLNGMMYDRVKQELNYSDMQALDII